MLNTYLKLLTVFPHLDIPIFNQVMAMVEANYPEMLDACYVIKGKSAYFYLFQQGYHCATSKCFS